MILTEANPTIFISPQLAERANGANIVGMTTNQYDVADTVNTKIGSVRPNVGALILRDKGERGQNPELLHLPPTGALKDAPLVDLEEIRWAARSEQVHPLYVQPRALTLEGLRKATHIAVGKWHDASGAWDEPLWFGTVGGGGLGLAADILYNGFQFGDFSSLREKAIAAGAGALLGAAGTPLLRNLAYRSSVPRMRGYPIGLQYAEPSAS